MQVQQPVGLGFGWLGNWAHPEEVIFLACPEGVIFALHLEGVVQWTCPVVVHQLSVSCPDVETGVGVMEVVVVVVVADKRTQRGTVGIV